MDLFGQAAAAVNAFLAAHTYLALVLLLFVEEAGVPLPVPGETLIVYTGLLIATGRAEPLPALVCILLGVGAGSSLLYTIARRGGLPLLRRFGRFLRLDDAGILRMQGWMQAHPAPAVVGGRLIPGLRIATSVVAGTFRVRYPAFIAFALASTAAWSAACPDDRLGRSPAAYPPPPKRLTLRRDQGDGRSPGRSPCSAIISLGNPGNGAGESGLELPAR